MRTLETAAPMVRRKNVGGWLVLGGLWLLALGFLALTATNYYRVAKGGDVLERMYRASPLNTVGRGMCARYERTQPPMIFDEDGLCWIDLTQRQIEDGTVRPHDFPYDNAPYGRERHWSSSFSWWLLAVGGVTRLWSGLPLTQAVGQSAAWANPVLFVLFLNALGLVLRRRLDAWASGIFLVTLASLTGVEWDFSYGRPDHHGLHLMAFLGLLLSALMAGMGWVRVEGADDEPGENDGRHMVAPQPWRKARGWFTASGICGGMGLWIGSTQQCVCIGMLGVGTVLGTWLFARRTETGQAYRFAPELWRHWARVGSATSLAFYLIEYFPAHMEMRLEVNHPFMALGWLGAGEVMYVALLLRVDWPGVKRRSGEMLLRAGLGLMGMSVLPLALVFGPKAWWMLSDPMMMRLTKVVSEGRPFVDPWSLAKAADNFLNSTGVLLAAMLLAAGVLIMRRRQMPPWRQAALVAALATAGMFLAWTLLQTRWLGFLDASLAVLALLVAPSVPLPAVVVRRRLALPLVLLALTVPGWVNAAWVQARALDEDPRLHAKGILRDMMYGKEAAWNLRLDGEKLGLRRSPRVMAPPGPGPILHYYGGVDAVGSYYWENLPGNHVVVDFFMDESGGRARRIARERELDFVMVITKPGFVLELQLLQLGYVDPVAVQRSLAFRLSTLHNPQPPEWLEELPLVDAPMAQEMGVRIYRVIKDRL